MDLELVLERCRFEYVQQPRTGSCLFGCLALSRLMRVDPVAACAWIKAKRTLMGAAVDVAQLELERIARLVEAGPYVEWLKSQGLDDQAVIAEHVPEEHEYEQIASCSNVTLLVHVVWGAGFYRRRINPGHDVVSVLYTSCMCDGDPKARENWRGHFDLLVDTESAEFRHALQTYCAFLSGRGNAPRGDQSATGTPPDDEETHTTASPPDLGHLRLDWFPGIDASPAPAGGDVTPPPPPASPSETDAEGTAMVARDGGTVGPAPSAVPPEKCLQLWEAQGRDILPLLTITPTTAAIENSLVTAAGEAARREWLYSMAKDLQEIPDERLRSFKDAPWMLAVKAGYREGTILPPQDYGTPQGLSPRPQDYDAASKIYVDAARALGLDPTDSLSNFRKTYYQQARGCHPDKTPEGVEEFKEIASAFGVVSQSSTRDQYLDEAEDCAELRMLRSNLRIGLSGLLESSLPEATFAALKASQIKSATAMARVLFGLHGTPHGVSPLRTADQGLARGCILTDPPGAGKTLTAIACLAILDCCLDVNRVLVIAPAAVVHHWANELERWLGQHPLLDNIAVMSYDQLIRAELGSLDVVVCDEAHLLKNAESLRAKSFQNLAVRYRILLTGTPIQNAFHEWCQIVECAHPGAIPEVMPAGGQDELVEGASCLFIKSVDSTSTSEQQRRVLHVYLRTTSLQEKFSVELRTLFQGRHVLPAMVNMEKVAVRPGLFSPEHMNAHSPKLALCIQLASRAVDAGEKVVLCSRYVQVLQLLKEKLQAAGL